MIDDKDNGWRWSRLIDDDQQLSMMIDDNWWQLTIIYDRLLMIDDWSQLVMIDNDWLCLTMIDDRWGFYKLHFHILVLQTCVWQNTQATRIIKFRFNRKKKKKRKTISITSVI